MKPATELKAQRSRWSKTAALVALGALTVVLATACGNKGGGAAPTPPPPIPVNPNQFGSCVGCMPNMVLLGTALGTSLSAYGGKNFELGLEFYGEGSTVASMNGSFGAASYAGPVAAHGFLHVYTAEPLCNLPAGSYQVTTTAPGIWGGGGRSFGSLSLMAMGPVQAQIVIPSAYVSPAIPADVSNDGRQFPYRIYGRVVINNSYYCNILIAE